jgi:hypothetical protein
VLTWKHSICAALVAATGSSALAVAQEIGPWSVHSESDNFSFSALGSMLTLERGFDRDAGVMPQILIIGCDADPEKRFEIEAWVRPDGFYIIEADGEPEVTVHASFDGGTVIEQRWILYHTGPFIGSAAPYEVNDTWFSALASASTLQLTFKGDAEIGVPDRAIDFDVDDFATAFDALVCGKVGG